MLPNGFKHFKFKKSKFGLCQSQATYYLPRTSSGFKNPFQKLEHTTCYAICKSRSKSSACKNLKFYTLEGFSKSIKKIEPINYLKFIDK